MIAVNSLKKSCRISLKKSPITAGFDFIDAKKGTNNIFSSAFLILFHNNERGIIIILAAAIFAEKVVGVGGHKYY